MLSRLGVAKRLGAYTTHGETSGMSYREALRELKRLAEKRRGEGGE